MILTALADHVWQSTVFSVIAGLVVLTLRRQGARVRYWLWLAASVKFLIPFSLLFALGRRSASFHSPIGATTKLQIAIDAISGPRSTTVFPDVGQLWPVLLGGWLCGFLVVLLVWFRQWRRMLAVARDGVTLREGREIESLRRVEHRSRTPIRVEIRQCRATLEPGVFGFSHPLLLWPSGISERLDDSQLDAILAHEMQHVRQNDNLTATVHVLVEALFWFHPLVWWLGARMMEERERACDEDVLDLGSDRHVYAESILKVCEFCIGSPLASVSGVAGGNLKERMANIMMDRKLCKLDFTRKLFLSAAGVGVVALPLAFGVLSAVPRMAQAQTKSTASAQLAGSGQVRESADEMKKFVLKKVPPSYPESAKNAGIQGKVVLNATISKEGDISDLRIVSGHPQLVEAAIEAVKQWKYRPYLQDGKPVEVTTEIVVNFTLGKISPNKPDGQAKP